MDLKPDTKCILSESLKDVRRVNQVLRWSQSVVNLEPPMSIRLVTPCVIPLHTRLLRRSCSQAEAELISHRVQELARPVHVLQGGGVQDAVLKLKSPLCCSQNRVLLSPSTGY